MSQSEPHAGPPGRDLAVDPQWEVHPADVKEWMDARQDLILLDVRLLREWNFCHIEGATLVPLPQLDAQARHELQAFKQRRVVAYCHHGVRSLRAAALLRHCGFENVRSMAGGIEAWSLLIDRGVPRY